MDEDTVSKNVEGTTADENAITTNVAGTTKDNKPVAANVAGNTIDKNGITTNVAGNTTDKNGITTNVAGKATDTCSADTSSMPNKCEGMKKEGKLGNLENDTTSSTSDFLDLLKSGKEKPTVIHRTTSTPDGLPCGCPETIFFHMYQKIGTGSRYTEFKSASCVFDRQNFPKIIGSYVCGFLNSEGGTIFFGVAEDGRVVGIKLNRYEIEDLRDEIEYVIQSIKPQVEAEAYSINFARVVEGNDDNSGNYKVIEVCVKPCKPPDSFYTFRKVIYVRRDVGLQRIDPRHGTAAGLSQQA